MFQAGKMEIPSDHPSLLKQTAIPFPPFLHENSKAIRLMIYDILEKAI